MKQEINASKIVLVYKCKHHVLSNVVGVIFPAYIRLGSSYLELDPGNWVPTTEYTVPNR